MATLMLQPRLKKRLMPIAGPTINYENAHDFAKKLKAEVVIPIHNDNPAYPCDPHEFAKLFATSAFRIIPLANAQSVEI